MKLHRFITNIPLKPGNLQINSRELVNQIKKVLKLKPGEMIILCDGKMNDGLAEIKNYGKDSIIVELKEIKTNQNNPAEQIILYCSILKKDNFELVAQKATEIGITEIIPLITARTIKLDVRRKRLEKIIKEAAEQSGRGTVPLLNEPINFKRAVSDVDKNNLNIFLNKSGENFTYFKPETSHRKLTTIFVGPEGGWTQEELDLAEKLGLKIISLGRTTLRSETAAIIGSYLALTLPVHN